MAEQGAGNLVLMSRSGPGDRISAEIDRLRSEGVTIVDWRGDVTDPGAVNRAVEEIQNELPPLKAVVHAAMVIEDDLIAELDGERFDRALRPKILGAWNLHRAVSGIPLDHFICFSSFSALVGGPRQSNYNAGNAFLDALAHHRRSLGLPGLTVNWGALHGAGFLERNQKTADYLDKTGLGSFAVPEALRILRELILRDPGSIGAARVDWQKLSRFSPLVARTPAFAPLASDRSRDPSGLSVRARALSAPSGEREDLIGEFLAEKVAGVLGVEPNQVDRSTPITNLGLDSLMAVELVNCVESDLGMNVPMGNLMSGPDVTELSAVIIAMLELDQEGENPDGGTFAGLSAPPAPPCESARCREYGVSVVR